jgi:hypothetical protein
MSAAPVENDDVDNRLKSIYSGETTTKRSSSASFVHPTGRRLSITQNLWRRTMSGGKAVGVDTKKESLTQKAKNRLSKVFNVNTEDSEGSPNVKSNNTSNGELSLVEQYYREQEQQERDREEKRKSQCNIDMIVNFNELQEMIKNADESGVGQSPRTVDDETDSTLSTYTDLTPRGFAIQGDNTFAEAVQETRAAPQRLRLHSPVVNFDDSTLQPDSPTFTRRRSLVFGKLMQLKHK